MKADTIKINSKQALMIAHRGLSGIETENSNFAFTAAGQRSYFGIETDVHVTKDGKYVIIHDDYTGRVGDKDLHVEESTFDELRSVCLKDREDCVVREDIKIPTLDDYVKICKRYGKVGVLEIKNHMEVKDIEGVINVIKERDYLNDIIFISFDLENCLNVRKLLPNQRVQHLTGEYNNEGLIKIYKENNIDIDIVCNALTNNPDAVDFLHKNGIKVNCWTVDDAETANKLVEMGVDFITTDLLE